jgi:glycosyltransferase involved in cell wall biosynthesis
MAQDPPRICLNMIVKDEAPVIGRCLAALRNFVDHWVIVDTGSSDGTQALVRQHMNGMPGSLHQRPWRHFEHNRNEALDLALRELRPADYMFFIDADETLVLAPDWQRPPLSADAYQLACHYDGLVYARTALVAARLPWRWRGVVHEALDCGGPCRIEPLSGPCVHVSHDGARSRDPHTYRKDAALLEEALRADPTNARHVYYLAQSLRDAGELPRSREVYRQRAAMGGWEEEAWHAQYQAALLTERLNEPAAEVAFAYLQAYARRPSRAEPLLHLARWHRLRGEHALALLFARQVLALPRPADILFVEDPVYRWQGLDEVSVSAWYAGARAEGRQALQRLLATKDLPPGVRERAVQNLTHYI